VGLSMNRFRQNSIRPGPLDGIRGEKERPRRRWSVIMKILGAQRGQGCGRGQTAAVAVVNGEVGGRGVVRWQSAIDERAGKMRDKRAKQQASRAVNNAAATAGADSSE
jgi:hypothetical protein